MTKAEPATPAHTLLARAILSRSQTAAAAAESLGISGASMSRILNGKQIPSADLRRRISTAYRVPVRVWPATRTSASVRRLAAGGEALS